MREHGIVLQSAHGPLPNLADQIAGEPIHGSWWGHRRQGDLPGAHPLLAFPDWSPRAWSTGGRAGPPPALAGARPVADRFPAERLAAVDEVHTTTGAHRTVAIHFPEWVPDDDVAAGALLTVDEALALLPDCLR